MAHLRCREDLFKIQRDILSRYHVTTANAFYGGQGFWAVPPDPTVDGNTPPPQPPYYVQVQMPEQAAPVFSLTTTLTPRQRNQAAAFIAVSSAPGKDYGTIRVMEFKPESNTPGPQQVQNNFDANSEVSQQLGLLRTKGSTVSYGNLLTLPLTNVGGADKTDGGLLYVEPVYVQRSTGSASYPLLQKVLVAYGEKIGFQDTLDAALEEAFTGTDSPTTGNNGGGSNTGGGNGGGSDNQALTQALDDATQALADSQTALA